MNVISRYSTLCTCSCFIKVAKLMNYKNYCIIQIILFNTLYFLSLNQACVGLCTPGFLTSFRLKTLVYVCVHTPRPLITSHVKGIYNNWIRQFYGFSVSLYDMINWMGKALVTLHVINACQGNAILATKGLPGSTNKLELFNYNGEWANA